MELTEVCPCDDCSQKYKCAEYELACGAFFVFALYGSFDREMARIPTGHVFHKIFKEDDQAQKNYMKSQRAKNAPK